MIFPNSGDSFQILDDFGLEFKNLKTLWVLYVLVLITVEKKITSLSLSNEKLIYLIDSKYNQKTRNAH